MWHCILRVAFKESYEHMFFQNLMPSETLNDVWRMPDYMLSYACSMAKLYQCWEALQVKEDSTGNVKIASSNAGKDFAAEEISAQVLRKLTDDAAKFLNDKVSPP